MVGVYEGEVCGRDGCSGVLEAHPHPGGCTCFQSAPCSVCTVNRQYCPTCEWEAQDE